MSPESIVERWAREARQLRTVGEPPDIVPAATVVLLRDGAAGVETLMLRKNSRLVFGGMWVFPGGRLDAADREGAADAEHAARRAAVREALEEADLVVDESGLEWISHWTPPAAAPRRFATWFFVARAPARAVATIDGGEIHDHSWMAPGEALDRRDAGEIELAPPTWMTLHHLAQFRDVAAALADASRRVPEVYETRIAKGARGLAAIWAGDVAYDDGDADRPGPRHRLWMLPDGWVLERSA